MRMRLFFLTCLFCISLAGALSGAPTGSQVGSGEAVGGGCAAPPPETWPALPACPVWNSATCDWDVAEGRILHYEKQPDTWDGTTALEDKVLYVRKGVTIRFWAGGPRDFGLWPADAPFWSIADSNEDSLNGQRVISVKFETTSLSMDDCQEIKVSCSSTEGLWQSRIRVIVFEIEGKIRFHDNWPERSRTQVGVGELVELKYETIPSHGGSPISGNLIGDPEWISHSPRFPNSNFGNVSEYEIHFTLGQDTFTLELQSGVNKGSVNTISLTRVRPQAMLLRSSNPNLLSNTRGRWGFAECLEPYILPKNVSFVNVQLQEGQLRATATGWIREKLGDLVHPSQPFSGIFPGRFSMNPEYPGHPTMAHDIVGVTESFAIDDFRNDGYWGADIPVFYRTPAMSLHSSGWGGTSSLYDTGLHCMTNRTAILTTTVALGSGANDPAMRYIKCDYDRTVGSNEPTRRNVCGSVNFE